MDSSPYWSSIVILRDMHVRAKTRRDARAEMCFGNIATGYAVVEMVTGHFLGYKRDAFLYD